MAKFVIDVDITGKAKIADLEKSVKNLDKEQKKTTKSTNDFSKALVGLGVAAASYIIVDKLKDSIVAIGGSTIKTAMQFERFNTILGTLEGSADKAQKSFEWIQDFTKTTPFQLQQTTDAFIKLRSYGLDPTNGLLRTLGDTSAAMGKDIIQAVEAIADAVTGENERLKEFGIKASKQGEETMFTWSNASGKARQIVVKNNAEIIESTLQAIFNSKYEGASDKLSMTLEGIISNIKDEWTQFQNNIMAGGLFDYIKSLSSVIKDELTVAFGDFNIKTKDGLENVKDFNSGITTFFENSIRGIAKIVKGWNTFSNGIDFGTIAFKQLGIVFATAGSVILDVWDRIQIGVETIKEGFDQLGYRVRDVFFNIVKDIKTSLVEIMQNFIKYTPDFMLDGLGITGDKIKEFNRDIEQQNKNIEANATKAQTSLEDYEATIDALSKKDNTLIDLDAANAEIETLRKNIMSRIETDSFVEGEIDRIFKKINEKIKEAKTVTTTVAKKDFGEDPKQESFSKGIADDIRHSLQGGIQDAFNGNFSFRSLTSSLTNALSASASKALTDSLVSNSGLFSASGGLSSMGWMGVGAGVLGGLALNSFGSGGMSYTQKATQDFENFIKSLEGATDSLEKFGKVGEVNAKELQQLDTKKVDLVAEIAKNKALLEEELAETFEQNQSRINSLNHNIKSLEEELGLLDEQIEETTLDIKNSVLNNLSNIYALGADFEAKNAQLAQKAIEPLIQRYSDIEGLVNTISNLSLQVLEIQTKLKNATLTDSEIAKLEKDLSFLTQNTILKDAQTYAKEIESVFSFNKSQKELQKQKELLKIQNEAIEVEQIFGRAIEESNRLQEYRNELLRKESDLQNSISNILDDQVALWSLSANVLEDVTDSIRNLKFSFNDFINNIRVQQLEETLNGDKLKRLFNNTLEQLQRPDLASADIERLGGLATGFASSFLNVSRQTAKTATEFALEQSQVLRSLEDVSEKIGESQVNWLELIYNDVAKDTTLENNIKANEITSNDLLFGIQDLTKAQTLEFAKTIEATSLSEVENTGKIFSQLIWGSETGNLGQVINALAASGQLTDEVLKDIRNNVGLLGDDFDLSLLNRVENINKAESKNSQELLQDQINELKQTQKEIESVDTNTYNTAKSLMFELDSVDTEGLNSYIDYVNNGDFSDSVKSTFETLLRNYERVTSDLVLDTNEIQTLGSLASVVKEASLQEGSGVDNAFDWFSNTLSALMSGGLGFNDPVVGVSPTVATTYTTPTTQAIQNTVENTAYMGGAGSTYAWDVQEPDAQGTDPGWFDRWNESFLSGFSIGGFTGGQDKNKVAGVVHEGEWVAPKWMVEKYPSMINNLESLRVGTGSENPPTLNTQNMLKGSNDMNLKLLAENNNYQSIIANRLDQLLSLFRTVTNGGNAMIVELQ